MVAYHESVVRERIAAYIRLFQPHIVITHYPYPNFEAPQSCNNQCSPPSSWDDSGYHPDHKAVGWHVLNNFMAVALLRQTTSCLRSSKKLEASKSGTVRSCTFLL